MRGIGSPQPIELRLPIPTAQVDPIPLTQMLEKKLEFKVKTVQCQVVLQLTLKQFYQISTPLLKPSFDTLEIVSYCRLRIQVDF